MYEHKLNYAKAHVSYAFAWTQSFLPNPTTSSPMSLSKPTTTPSVISKIPFKRLSASELQDRRDKGLWYNCDEKYTIGHLCKSLPQLLFLEESSESSFELPDSFCPENFRVEELQCLEIQPHSAIYYHALLYGTCHSTPRFNGHVQGSLVQVLVNGGNINNFVEARVAKYLNMFV